jgi:hypothetical protein
VRRRSEPSPREDEQRDDGGDGEELRGELHGETSGERERERRLRLRERDEEREPCLAIAAVLAVEARAHSIEAALDARAHGLHGNAEAPRDRGRRLFLEEAQEQRRSVRLLETEHRVHDLAAQRLALDDVRGRRQALGTRRRVLARATPPLASRAEAHDVAHDRREPRARPRRVARRALERGDVRLLHGVVDLRLVGEKLPRDRAHEVAVGQQHLGIDRSRHRPPPRSECRGRANWFSGGQGTSSRTGTPDDSTRTGFSTQLAPGTSARTV